MELRGRGTELHVHRGQRDGAAARLRAVRGAAARREIDRLAKRLAPQQAPPLRRIAYMSGRRHRRRRHGHGRRAQPFARRICDPRARYPAEAENGSGGARRDLPRHRRPRSPRACEVVVLLVVDTRADRRRAVRTGRRGGGAAAGSIVLRRARPSPPTTSRRLAPRVAATGGELDRRAGLRRTAARRRRHDDDDDRGRAGGARALRTVPRGRSRARCSRSARGPATPRSSRSSTTCWPRSISPPAPKRWRWRRRRGSTRAARHDVVNASSGGSWMFADRMPRALAGDYAPRAAARILTKDVGLAVDFAAPARRRRARSRRPRAQRSPRRWPRASARRTMRRSSSGTAQRGVSKADAAPARGCKVSVAYAD